MARKLKDNYNIDTLKLCYREPEGLFEFVTETKPETKIHRDGYYLYVIGDEEDENPKSVQCNAIADTGEEICTITLNASKSKYGNLCFIKLNNKALYTVVSYDCYMKANMLACVEYIADDLGLSFVSVTELHIALDSNINRIAKLMRIKGNTAHFDMIVNRRKVDASKQKIRGYREDFQSTRKRRVNPTIYIEQKKEYAPRLCLYNKTVEIKEASGKEYIKDWNEFGNQTIYRSELRLRWESIKDYFFEKGVEGYGIFVAILQTDTLKDIFNFFASRLVYFRNKHTDEVITIDSIA